MAGCLGAAGLFLYTRRFTMISPQNLLFSPRLRGTGFSTHKNCLEKDLYVLNGLFSRYPVYMYQLISFLEGHNHNYK